MTILPAEWAPQSAIQLTWPHADTDWANILPEAEACYVRMAREIARREPLLVVTPEPERVEALLQAELTAEEMARVELFECPTDDTWARDHAFITLQDGDALRLLDFRFNGWGQKFAAANDNQICRRMMQQSVLKGTYESHLDFVLEGGSIESDGEGTILTTTECLLAPNRNEPLAQAQIEAELKRRLHAERICGWTTAIWPATTPTATWTRWPASVPTTP